MKNMPDPESAQVGIGTMIVFIATVLVAAIAAGVLISTSSDLQTKSAKTGSEATEQVASNLVIETARGTRSATSDAGLQGFDIYVALAPGASEVDLEQMRIQINDGSALTTISYAATASATEYSAVSLRDVDSSFSASTPVMNSGDLVAIHLDLTTATGLDMEWEPRTDIVLTMLPEVGNPVRLGFDTPNSYGDRLVIDI